MYVANKLVHKIQKYDTVIGLLGDSQSLYAFNANPETTFNMKY